MGAKAEKTLGQPEPPPTSESSQAAGALGHVKDLEKKKKKNCCGLKCCTCWTRYGVKILLVVLTVLTILQAIAVVVNALVMAQMITSYDPDNNGRAVAMIVLIISICGSMAAALYATTAAFKKQRKNLKMAGVILVILALVQLLIALLSALPSTNEDASLNRSLQESFTKNLLHVPKAVEQWSITQNGLSCCGLNSPDDYRLPQAPPFFPPDVPISCCPSYQPSRSPLVQERERETCKERREYFDEGCRRLVVPAFNTTSIILASLTVVLLIFQLALTIASIWYAYIIGKKKKRLAAVEGGAELENTEAAPNSKP